MGENVKETWASGAFGKATKEAVKEALAEAEGTKKKPGIKTSECWITLVIGLAGLIVSSGVLEGTENPYLRIAGLIAAAIAASGYSAARAKTKVSE